MRLLFTDIDGVFNNLHSRRKTRKDGILRDAVQLFDAFILQHNISIVLTSEQRRYTTLHDLLDILGTTQRARFLDTTPVFSLDPRVLKSDVIAAWLHACVHSAGEPVVWAILDDNALHFTISDLPRLVLVDPRVGLTDAHLARVLQLLDPVTPSVTPT